MRMLKQMPNVVAAAGEIVVDTDDIIPAIEKTFAQMRPQESSTTCHQDPFARARVSHNLLCLQGSGRGAGELKDGSNVPQAVLATTSLPNTWINDWEWSVAGCGQRQRTAAPHSST